MVRLMDSHCYQYARVSMVVKPRVRHAARKASRTKPAQTYGRYVSPKRMSLVCGFCETMIRNAGAGPWCAGNAYPAGQPTVNENTMKQALQAYIDAFNRSDWEGIAALYAEDATVEDPVGKHEMQGRAAIAAFYKASVATGAQLRLAAPIRASHGNAAAMAFDVTLNMPQGPALIRVIDVMTFDDDGLFSSMRAYWGPSDMTLAEG